MFKRRSSYANDKFASTLHDQNTFYPSFQHDLKNCSSELIIESPFITTRRTNEMLPLLRKLVKRGVRVYINTRDPSEHDPEYAVQAYDAVYRLQALGATVLYTAKHHRKLAIIDRQIIWEGSLNILSHSNSCEIMRKINSPALAQQLIQFLHLEHHLLQLGGEK
jgi:phosphatidylserine/phosphatidylglycerophosphate/cardiolipin synthase-like enzyme